MLGFVARSIISLNQTPDRSCTQHKALFSWLDNLLVIYGRQIFNGWQLVFSQRIKKKKNLKKEASRNESQVRAVIHSMSYGINWRIRTPWKSFPSPFLNTTRRHGDKRIRKKAKGTPATLSGAHIMVRSRNREIVTPTYSLSRSRKYRLITNSQIINSEAVQTRHSRCWFGHANRFPSGGFVNGQEIALRNQVPASSWPGVRRCESAGSDSGNGPFPVLAEVREDTPRRRAGINRDQLD